MAALVIFAILLILAVTGPRWGVDSRHARHPNDRVWSPDGS
jgi:hypothetical protein